MQCCSNSNCWSKEKIIYYMEERKKKGESRTCNVIPRLWVQNHALLPTRIIISFACTKILSLVCSKVCCLLDGEGWICGATYTDSESQSHFIKHKCIGKFGVCRVYLNISYERIHPYLWKWQEYYMWHRYSKMWHSYIMHVA